MPSSDRIDSPNECPERKLTDPGFHAKPDNLPAIHNNLVWSLGAGIVACWLILMLTWMTGCATTEPSAGNLQTGTFRGRWWDYYERGRTLLDRGQYAEAESDLSKALANRGEDQRWARTYGLHFIPEYFPNRELGILRFRQGQLDEAESRLSASLASERSALAAHFLSEVRAARIAQSGGDTEAPRIQLNEAPGEGAVSGFEIPVTATVSDNHYVSRITVNGEPYPIDLPAQSIDLSRRVALDAGNNDIVIEASDLSGNVSRQSLAWRADHDGPSVSFNDPVELPGVVTGTLFDPAGVASLEVAGTAATLEADADGAYRFRAELTGALPAPPVLFRAHDALGNLTEGRVPVHGVSMSELNGVTVPASAMRRVDYENGVSAYFVGGLVARVELAQAGGGGLKVSLPNLSEGQRYLMDEIMVSVDVEGAEKLESLTIDGRSVEGLVPGRGSQHLSRRLHLEGMGAHEVVAEARAAGGAVSTARISIERVATAIEAPEEKLRVALLGNLWDGAAPRVEDEVNFVAESLTRALFDRGRFDLVSRDAMPRVLEERELQTVLGSRAIDPGLRQLVPADLLTVGKVRRSGDTIEIILQAVSAADSSILGYADVAGKADTPEQLRALAADLALRFEQEFPRVSGTVVQASNGGQCFTTLTQADRVRTGMACIVYRFGEEIRHPQTGTVLGRPVDIIAHGKLDEVRPTLSRVGLDNVEQTNGTNVSNNDLVITK